MFDDTTVKFVYGCMGHDFNWRNFHWIHHHIDYRPEGGSWNPAVAKEANRRLKNDLEALCDANREGAPESHRHFDWEISTDAENALCKAAAKTMRTTLDAVVSLGEPLSFLPVLGIDYPHGG